MKSRYTVGRRGHVGGAARRRTGAPASRFGRMAPRRVLTVAVAAGCPRHVQVEVDAGEPDEEAGYGGNDRKRKVVAAALGCGDDDRGAEQRGNRVETSA